MLIKTIPLSAGYLIRAEYSEEIEGQTVKIMTELNIIPLGIRKMEKRILTYSLKRVLFIKLSLVSLIEDWS